MSGYKPELKKRPQISNVCTGCYYKYKQGDCPDEARAQCLAEKIIFQKVKK